MTSPEHYIYNYSQRKLFLTLKICYLIIFLNDISKLTLLIKQNIRVHYL
jgi:hypothetical protein